MSKNLVTLDIDGVKSYYSSETGLVTIETKHRVFIECRVPEKWSVVRIVQFMASLIKANREILI